MKRLRWAMDGEGRQWELDISTPVTLQGEARPVPGDPLPLAVTRGPKLSRYKQTDFFQRFMAAPFLLSSSPSSHGISLLRSLTLPLTRDWFVSLLAMFKLQKLVSVIREDRRRLSSDESPLLPTIKKHLRDKSLYSLGWCSEMLMTPYDTLLCSVETSGDPRKGNRKRAVLHHEFPHHDLTVEAASPSLFMDDAANYWDVPLSMAIDLASVTSGSGASYHLCMQHKTGKPVHVEGDHDLAIPASLLPGTSMKLAFSLKKDLEIWKSEEHKLKLVQPYDLFLCNPHISASGTIGGAVTARRGENAAAAGDNFPGICIRAPEAKSALTADFFSSISLTAQHGNFQKLFLDLTRFGVRLDFPSGGRFLSGASRLAPSLMNSSQTEDLRAVCPDVTVSFQQQIIGPFSFRVDSKMKVDLRGGGRRVHFHDPIFAVEHALHVLGSAKSVAWFSPKTREFMVELRFFEA